MSGRMIRVSAETHAMIERIRETMQQRAAANASTAEYAYTYDSVGMGTIIALLGMDWEEKNARPLVKPEIKRPA